MTVITEDVLTPLGLRSKIQTSNRVLCGPDGNRLPVAGEISLRVSYNGHATTQIVYVL